MFSPPWNINNCFLYKVVLDPHASGSLSTYIPRDSLFTESSVYFVKHAEQERIVTTLYLPRSWFITDEFLSNRFAMQPCWVSGWVHLLLAVNGKMSVKGLTTQVFKYSEKFSWKGMETNTPADTAKKCTDSKETARHFDFARHKRSSKFPHSGIDLHHTRVLPLIAWTLRLDSVLQRFELQRSLHP